MQQVEHTDRIICSASNASGNTSPQDRQGSTGPEYFIHGSSEINQCSQCHNAGISKAMTTHQGHLRDLSSDPGVSGPIHLKSSSRATMPPCGSGSARAANFSVRVSTRLGEKSWRMKRGQGEMGGYYQPAEACCARLGSGPDLGFIPILRDSSRPRAIGSQRCLPLTPPICHFNGVVVSAMTVLQHPHLARRLANSCSSYTDFPTQADYHDTPEILLVWARIVVTIGEAETSALWGTSSNHI
jgi:hypothetical protein